MKEAIPSMFTFDVSGFQVKWGSDDILFFPFDKPYYPELRKNESEYFVSMVFPFSLDFHDVLKVVCADESEAEAFYEKVKRKI